MFNPTLDTELVIDNQVFTFTPHPAVSSIVWGQEGRHAIVFRMENDLGDAYGLKVFRPVFRHDGLIDAAAALQIYNELPGMQVCDQIVIRPDAYPDLVAENPDLDYAMLMPWIEGKTWFDVLNEATYVSLDQSRAMAESMVWVLYALELNNLAHCDLSSGNVIIDPRMDRIQLIDVEDLYSPWLNTPPYVPAGSMGYQHRDVIKQGQWNPLGDRFAGAVILAEMLGWAHPEIRKRAWGESYFAPDELQQQGERYDVLRDVLRVYHPGFAEAFEQAWRSKNLHGCPPIKTWYDLLDLLPREPVMEWATINPEDFPPPPKPKPQSAQIAGKGRKSQADLQQVQSQSNTQNGCVQGCAKGCRQIFATFAVLTMLSALVVFGISAFAGTPLF